jgi:hypothetical protein
MTAIPVQTVGMEGGPQGAAGAPARPENDAAHGRDTGSEPAGGEPACWAHLVCDQCGVISGDPHRAWCEHARAAEPGSAS